MKKFIIILALLVFVSSLFGCVTIIPVIESTVNDSETSAVENSTVATDPEVTQQFVPADEIKLGTSAVCNVTNEVEKASVNVIAASVLINNDIIMDCSIDSLDVTSKDNTYTVTNTLFSEYMTLLVPRMISAERFENEILAKIPQDTPDEQLAYRRLEAFYQYIDIGDESLPQAIINRYLELYPMLTKEMPIYVLTEATLREFLQFEYTILKYIPDYTFEELEKDHKQTQFNYTVETALSARNSNDVDVIAKLDAFESFCNGKTIEEVKKLASADYAPYVKVLEEAAKKATLCNLTDAKNVSTTITFALDHEHTDFSDDRNSTVDLIFNFVCSATVSDASNNIINNHHFPLIYEENLYSFLNAFTNTIWSD